MEPARSVGRETLDFAGDFDLAISTIMPVLLEGDRAGYTRGPSQHSDGVDWGVRHCVAHEVEADEELDEKRDGRGRVHGGEYWDMRSNVVNFRGYICEFHCLVMRCMGSGSCLGFLRRSVCVCIKAKRAGVLPV